MRRSKNITQPNRISPEKRQEMFDVFEQTGSVNQVSKRCQVHSKTVRRYRVEDDWDTRVASIENKVQVKVEEKVVNRRLRNVQLVDSALENIEFHLKQANTDKKLIMDPKILPKLILAQEHLLGRGAADEEEAELSPEVLSAMQLLQKLPQETIVQIAALAAERILGSGDKGEAPVLALPDKPTTKVRSNYTVERIKQ